MHRQLDEDEEDDEAFYSQLEVAHDHRPCSHGGIQPPDIGWKDFTARHQRSKRLLQRTGNFDTGGRGANRERHVAGPCANK